MKTGGSGNRSLPANSPSNSAIYRSTKFLQRPRSTKLRYHEKVDELRSLHKQSSELNPEVSEALSEVLFSPCVLSHTRSVEVQVTAARLYQGSVPEVLHLDNNNNNNNNNFAIRRSASVLCTSRAFAALALSKLGLSDSETKQDSKTRLRGGHELRS